jgi:hypothetical protein
MIDTSFGDWNFVVSCSTFKEESSFPATALKKVVFPDPGAPRTSVILETDHEIVSDDLKHLKKLIWSAILG